MATKPTRAPRFELRRGRSASTPWARTDGEPAYEPSATTPQRPSLPWLGILISVVGTIMLATLFGVPFPGELDVAVIAAVGALWVGHRTFRRIMRSHPGKRVVAVTASAVVAAGAFVPLFVVVLFVWIIIWLKTTPM